MKKFNEMLRGDVITKVPTKRLVDSVQVTNNPTILKWICDKGVEDYKSGHKSLMDDLRPELTDAFGRYNLIRVWEFRYKIWVLKYRGIVFNVFSAAGKGTSIEVTNMSSQDLRSGTNEKDIISFLEELSNSY